MAQRKTWQEKATASTILTKINRRRNPASSYTQLARELGAPVYYSYYGTGGPATSPTFRNHVRTMVGASSTSEVFSR